ncbi:hypothetical protein MSPP1_002371 [Malassezia sp. CBS 17886]|nr:hypothetical protein MSPP1_002371 [Malassezia sp. CBS 17886]
MAPSVLSTHAPSITGTSIMGDMSMKAHSDGLPAVVRKQLNIVPLRLPPREGLTQYSSHLWDAPKWTVQRSVGSLATQPADWDAGSQWTRVSGYGNAYDCAPESASDVHRRASMETIIHLFVPDPRPWHPFRFVRRTDPRQVLLMCAGTALTPSQVQAAELAHKVSRGQSGDYRSLASQFGSSENTNLQGGVGLVYCPTHALYSAWGMPEPERARLEENFARRLERPDFMNETTKRRAALRSAVAALEYVSWEDEGFDQIVVATHHAWIVRGISNDIWEWRRNGWRLNSVSVLGLPGGNVPDQDLWELLDYVVRRYEDIDCNCRFWHIPKEANSEAIGLAEVGATRPNQQPTTVRWTKKTGGGAG